MRNAISRLLLLAATALSITAHDIPNDVTIQAFLRPEGQIAHLLIRVPLVAMRDINFPEQAGNMLDIEASTPYLSDAAIVWVGNFIELYEGTTLLPKPKVVKTRLSLPADKSFLTYDSAIAHLYSPPLTNDTKIYWNQPTLDILFDYAIASDQSDFSIHPALARLGQRVVTVLRFLPAPKPGSADHVVRAFEYEGDPGLMRLDPHWYQAASRFVSLGFRHILDGTDHLLFLFCLVIPFRKFRALVPIVTSFTIAHSITLIASAYNLAPDALWFPPMIEVGIALSIVYMALENIVGGSTVHKRWIIAFAFGLVHGFGFSFALRETLQFAGSHMLTSLLSFNIGVELGQLMVLLIMIPVLDLLFKYVVAERMGIVILSALVAHTAWHWMQDRWGVLAKYHLAFPDLTPTSAADYLRWAIVLVVIAGIWWWVTIARRPRQS